MREDIRGGLKNALDRGESLDKAVYSLISAGYKESEVQAEANALGGAMNMISPPNISADSFSAPRPTPLSPYKIQDSDLPKKSNFTLILLISILAFLILGLIVSLLFKEEILALFN